MHGTKINELNDAPVWGFVRVEQREEQISAKWLTRKMLSHLMEGVKFGVPSYKVWIFSEVWGKVPAVTCNSSIFVWGILKNMFNGDSIFSYQVTANIGGIFQCNQLQLVIMIFSESSIYEHLMFLYFYFCLQIIKFW